MNDQLTTPLVRRDRGIGAVLLTTLAMAFNYGDSVTTLTDAIVFVGIFTPIVYLLFTLMATIANRIWR